MYPIIASFLSDVYDINEQQEKWKERIKRQWKESASFPRKKKKSVRKSLLLDWNIASYDVFNLTK